MSAQCEVTAKQVAGSPMSLFERYLTVWVGLCIVAGIALGHWFPQPFQAIGQVEVAQVNLPVAVLIWLMIIPMLLKVDFGALHQVREHWRGIGVIPQSGFALRDAYAAHDARRHFRSYADASRKRVGEMPPGCDCANVVLGKVYPNQCRLYGLACTPRKPVGPCMVSDEGACRIWWSAGYRDNEWEGRKKRQSVG